jgi:hypothetical protein
MKNVMKLSMLGLLLTASASEMQAMKVMTRMAAKSKEFIHVAKRNPLAATGAAVATLFVADLMINKAPVYCSKAYREARRHYKFTEKEFLARDERLQQARKAKLAAGHLAALEADRDHAAAEGIDADMKLNSITASRPLYTTRLATLIKNGVCRIPGVKTGASKISGAVGQVWAKMPNLRRTAPSA